MRTVLLLTALGPLCIVVACATAKKSYSDDDDATTTHSTGTGGAGGSTWTNSTTTSNTNTTNTTSSTTTTTGQPSCYAGHGDCDPMQSDCDSGGACDIDDTNQFVCFPAPNTAGKGAACDPQNGPYCMNGLTCVSDGTSSLCAAYCCSADDCGGGTCDDLQPVGGITPKICSG